MTLKILIGLWPPIFVFLFGACAPETHVSASEETDSGSLEDTGIIDTGFDSLVDADHDGFDRNHDCNDAEPFINPNALEDLGTDGEGDGIDNDCNGITDEKTDEHCDCPQVDTEETDLAKALDLCDGRFVTEVKKVYSAPMGQMGYGTFAALGNNNCLVAAKGCEMVMISTGPVSQPNPNIPESMGSNGTQESVDPRPQYNGDNPNGGANTPSCDKTAIVLELTAPSNAKGFSFDFLFGSSEYDEFVGKGYNDAFYAIIECADINNGKTTNIAFDDFGNEIEVDANFFENESHICDESGSGWGPDTQRVSGTTGWLRTSWSIKPAAKFSLTFSVHDENDCVLDSMAIIDNFQWHVEAVQEGTIPI